MPGRPLVSVIIPAYNSEKFISYTLKSVLEQDYDNYEVIVIDDCSTDRTQEIVDNFIKYSKRIRLIKTEKNSKQAVARNMGINISKGELLAFIDADDQWYPCHLSLCVGKILENAADIVYCGFYDSYCLEDLFEDHNKSIHPVDIGTYKGMDGVGQFLVKNRVPTSTVVLKKHVVKQTGLFDFQATPAEDYDLWIRSMLNGFTIAGIDKQTMIYRKHSASSTNSSGYRWGFNEQFYVINKNFTSTAINNLPEIVRLALATKLKYWIKFSEESPVRLKKIKYYFKFSPEPIDVKMYFIILLRLFNLIPDSRLNSSMTARITRFIERYQAMHINSETQL